MKKTVKRFMAMGVAATSMAQLMACGGANTASNQAAKSVEKPQKITVMCDGTVFTQVNGGDEFRKQLADATGIDITWIQPDHSSYYDAINNKFNSESTMPDVVLLSSDYYALYAANGFLWNMTDAWEHSESKNSGRLISTADNVLSALTVTGEDGNQAMYGLSTYSGNGCCTYIKKKWLTDSGIDPSKVEGTTMDFQTYYSYLKKMKDDKGKYVISSPGFVSDEVPYTNYLPEFYQKAEYSFYKDPSGKYVDGFTEQAMQDALQRIQTAVTDGVIDRESVNNSTSNCRDKFYSTDPSSESGVFTYWSGTWANTLKTNLEAKGLDGDLIAIKPIKELGTYVERIAPTWCITSHADNPEGIFTYFVDKMLDGGDVQMLWIYGAKGTHWDDKAETITLQGKENNPLTYSEGQFHSLPSPEKPDTLMNKDTLLTIGTFKNGDPGKDAVPEIARQNRAFFAENSKVATPLPMTEALSDNISDINIARKYIVAQVALDYMSVSDGMKYYQDTVGADVDAVLKSLNK